MVNNLFIYLFWTNISGIKFSFRLSPCNQKYENNNLLIFHGTILILAADNMLLFPRCPITYIPLCMSPTILKIKINKRLTCTCHVKLWPTPPSKLFWTLLYHWMWSVQCIVWCYLSWCSPKIGDIWSKSGHVTNGFLSKAIPWGLM